MVTGASVVYVLTTFGIAVVSVWTAPIVVYALAVDGRVSDGVRRAGLTGVALLVYLMVLAAGGTVAT
ncbi:MAG: hypothetical protein L0H59_05210 [Tomitella sp.]|nr:hypothetical protein [Tomitella sp.]